MLIRQCERLCVCLDCLCVWTVSMHFWRCLCVFVSAFVYWTTVGDPIVSSFLLTVSFLKCQSGENICSLTNNTYNLHFYTSNETNGVDKLADWLITVVSAHAHKPKQLILCLLGAGLMVCAGSCGFGGCWGGGTMDFWIRLIVWRECVNMKGEIEGAGVVWEDSRTVNDYLLVAPHPHCVCLNVCGS